MKNILLRSYEIVLFLFAISIVMTMYSMTVGDEEGQLFGISYGYYVLPLLLVNIIICINFLSCFNFKGIQGWLVLWIIIVSFNVLLLSTRKGAYLIRVNLWTTSFLSAYCLARMNENTVKQIVYLFLIIYIIGLFYFIQGKLFQLVNLKRGLEDTTNAIYCLVSIVPFLMLLKQKWLRLFLLIIAFVCTLYSNKRGAAIVMALAMIPTISNVFEGMQNKRSKRFLIIATGIAIVYLLYYIGGAYLNGRLFERFKEVEETGGSGRSEIWANVLDAYNSSNFGEQLLGHGHYAVSSLGNATAAHNDFLDVLYDYGLVGLFVYVMIHLSLIAKIFKLRKTKNAIMWPYITMYAVFLIMSLLSILIVQQRYIIFMAVFWGCMEGCRFRYRS